MVPHSPRLAAVSLAVGLAAAPAGAGQAVFSAQTSLVNVAVTVVGPTADAAACVVHIARIAEAGSVAGAVVRATALCLV